MKKLVLIGMLGLAMSSCQNLFKNKNAGSAEDPNKAVKVAARDYSITAENAYSDLFFDSTLLESYIRDQQLTDSTARGMRNFYNTRNYQYAWFTSQGLTEQGRGLWNLYAYSVGKTDSTTQQRSPAAQRTDSLLLKMDTVLNEDTLQVAKNDSSFAYTELALTRHFIEFAQTNSDRSINYSMIQRFFPVRKVDLMKYTDSLLNKQTEDSAFASSNKAYQSMKEHLRNYYMAAQQGGWQPIAAAAKGIKKGRSGPMIVAIKKRLQLTGEMEGSDTSAVYNDSLEVAVKNYQQRHGFKEDGIITDSLIHTMNVPVEERMEQMVLNMNRMLWNPAQRDSSLIQVNIPEFMLYVKDDTGQALSMEVIVGQEGTNTMMFNGNLNKIVFSPYWNIPESIVKNEIMPKMKSDPNYLKSQHMEVVRQNDSIPVIRQLPGPHNSLGGVKFLFPNTYDIYLHDTPDKGLFRQDQRAFSHGCIRVSKAEELAAYLLRHQAEWTPQRIREAMNSGKEQVVELKQAVPVAITYYTAWVDNDGQLHFRDDIYAHDERTAQLMFSMPASKRDLAINKAP